MEDAALLKKMELFHGLSSFEVVQVSKRIGHRKVEAGAVVIEDGSFGICEICDEPIGKKRLEARPETSLCIKCKEDQEREERTMG